MAAKKYDLSDLGATEVKDDQNDLASLGATPLGSDVSSLGTPYAAAGSPLPITDTSVLSRLGATALAGFGNLGRDIINLPRQAQSIFTSNPSIPEFKAGFDYGKAVGIDNPNIADKLIQGAIEYAPFSVVASEALLPKIGASLAKALGVEAVAGGAYGFASDQGHPVEGAAEGAALAPLAHLAATGAAKLPGLLKDSLSRYAYQGIKKGVLPEEIGQDLASVNQQVSSKVIDNFNQVKNKESSLWDELQNKASEYDKQKGGHNTFDDSGYMKKLQEKLSDLQDQSLHQSGKAMQNKDAEDMLEKLMTDQHDTLSSALDHNKALNIYYRDEMHSKNVAPKNIVNFAKKSLADSIEENLSNQQRTDLLDSWRNANASTREKNQTFNSIVSKTGKESPSYFSNISASSNPFTNDAGFISQYVPKDETSGTATMKQFAKMVGDQDSAKQALRSNYFSDALREDGMSGIKFINKYNKLSDEQKSYLFSQDQIDKANALNLLLRKYPDIEKTKGMSDIVGSLMGGGVGYGAGTLLGHPVLGGIIGATAGKVGTKTISNALDNPASTKYYTDLLNGKVTPGKYDALRQSLAHGLAKASTGAILQNNEGNK